MLKAASQPRIILKATGSEVGLALQTSEALAKQGVAVQVVSMPSLDAFRKQDLAYRQSVCPQGVPVVAVEAGVPDSWIEFTGGREWVAGIS